MLNLAIFQLLRSASENVGYFARALLYKLCALFIISDKLYRFISVMFYVLFMMQT